MTAAQVLATTSDGSVEAIMVTVVAVTVIATLLAVLWFMTRTVMAVRLAADDLHQESLRLLADMAGTVGHASAELERVDGLLGAAESISATVDSTSRLAYMTFSNPVVKILAFGTGTARAARRLRRSKED
ncbi:MAG: hypothetical protein M3N98_08870 [Actinomycetota bacterium]|nr:hypothetical protein [Actinomycetota bacterium]